MKKEQFLKECNHTICYDYTLLPSDIQLTKNITIICPLHGEFNQLARNHMRGRDCHHCANIKRGTSKRKLVESFVADAIAVHGPKYNYDLVKYVNNKTPVIILCLVHGEFFQTPDVHLRGSGCSICGQITLQSLNLISADQIIERSQQKHSNKYTYLPLECAGTKNKMSIICPIHGVFQQTISNHMYSGHGCVKCAAEDRGQKLRLSFDQKVGLANNVHGGKYTYEYCDNAVSDKVTIYCKEHGDFSQSWQNHIFLGSECPSCAGVGVYCHTLFENRPELKLLPGVFYIVLIQVNNQLYTKVGITSRSVKKRFNYMGHGDAVELIDVLFEMPLSLYGAFLAEQDFLCWLNANGYNCTKTKFDGYTESFELPPTEILELFSTFMFE